MILQTEESRKRLQKLSKVVRPCTFIYPYRLAEELDLSLYIGSEAFQITGSFKFRAAYNLAENIAETTVITASSGNFGQALACACRMLNKKCIVVMPSNSAKIKIDSTRHWGAQLELIDTKVKSRAEKVAELAEVYKDAYVASAYDDDFVIEGNASLGLEIADSNLDIDLVVAPIGGGGLCSGLASGIRKSTHPEIEVYAAEPALANDASRSLAAGKIISCSEESQTIADGARTLSVGKRNFEILKKELAGLIEVSEDGMKEALRNCFLLANLKLEPTAALSIAAVMANRDKFAGRKILCVASGGNVDPAFFTQLIHESAHK